MLEVLILEQLVKHHQFLHKLQMQKLNILDINQLFQSRSNYSSKSNSSIKTVADLKGKKVVLNKGSNVHYLLVKALENAGLKYSDIETTFLTSCRCKSSI
jgi:TRAP-type uncharacterized transport system substrate-binding protein